MGIRRRFDPALRVKTVRNAWIGRGACAKPRWQAVPLLSLGAWPALDFLQIGKTAMTTAFSRPLLALALAPLAALAA